MFFLDSPQDRKLPVERKFYLDLLGKSIQQGKNIALLGLNKTGKTSLTRSFIEAAVRKKEVVPVYIDLSRTSTPPENFSIEFVGSVAFWFLGISSQNYKRFLDIDYLLQLKDLGKAIEFIEKIKNETQKIKPDQRLMIESAFSFAEELARKSKKKILLCMDNFEHILDMNNYSQIKDILSIINFNSKNILYFVTSSAIVLMKKLLKNFSVEEIKNFSKEETKSLVESILGKADEKIIGDVFRFSGGNPYIAKAICNRYKKIRDVKKAFLSGLVLKDSLTYYYCEKTINDSLNRARGKALLKTILKVLSFVKRATLTEISRKIYRSAPVTKSLLERLVEVDLIVKHENMYSFSNPVLRTWFRFVSVGLETESLNDEMLERAEAELNE